MQQNSYEKSTGLHWFISPVVSAGGSTGFRTVVRLTTIAGIRSQGGCVPQGVRKRKIEKKKGEKEEEEKARTSKGMPPMTYFSQAGSILKLKK